MMLEGWKQISNYLGVTDRTAQNWAGTRGLPIHRLPGTKGRVFVDATVIDQWKLAGPTSVQRPVRKTITVRLTEGELAAARSLASSSMQEFVRRALAFYVKQNARSNGVS
jgi:hypothetical protein